MRLRRIGGALGSIAMVATMAMVTTSITAANASSPRTADGYPVTTLTMHSPAPYTPHAANGGTDDYHCTLVNPHVTRNSFIVSSQFFPGKGPSTVEVHHAILFLVPPQLKAAAITANAGGKGWTCFGEPPVIGAGRGLSQFFDMPWLSAWAPGHGRDVMPLTTGTPLPAGSLVIMQVHYNLLVGDKPVSPSVQLDTVPAAAKLRPASIQPLVAPPNIPCPSGVTGPLCNRSAEVANLAARFGPYITFFDMGMEEICGENPSDPPAGDSTTCLWHVNSPGYLVRAVAHMHLLGQSMKITLNPGTPQAQTVLDVPNYNFHYQRAYNLKKWVKVTAGEPISVSCTFNPELAQELPALRNVAPHYIMWGDGSSDEMCLGLVSEVPLDSHVSVDWASMAGSTTHSHARLALGVRARRHHSSV